MKEVIAPKKWGPWVCISTRYYSSGQGFWAWIRFHVGGYLDLYRKPPRNMR
jgi:hypothetical protein